jgi:SAM-dependent methyltransferase/uncharacterized protein YbaR (Trm112 family)
MTKAKDFSRFLDLAACPRCGGSGLQATGGAVVCPSCSHGYRVLEGVPILLSEPVDVQVMPKGHVSNPIPPEVASWLSTVEGYALNIGAGTSSVQFPRCIELEYAIFPTTDVIGDAHRLPFADGAFDAVVTLHTFEHLRAPAAAAAEIRRILRPGGRLLLRTAFVQPLHEEPYHYFNVTEFGLREWFRDFSVEYCSVPEDVSPALAFGWLATELTWYVGLHLGWDVSDRLATTTLGEWRRVWSDARSPERRTGLIWDTIRQLPPEVQARFSLGFELAAVRSAEVSDGELRPVPAQAQTGEDGEGADDR